MTTGLEQIIANNISAVIMAFIFINYLNKRDDKFQKSLDKLAEAIDCLERRIDHIRCKKRKEEDDDR